MEKNRTGKSVNWCSDVKKSSPNLAIFTSKTPEMWRKLWAILKTFTGPYVVALFEGLWADATHMAGATAEVDLNMISDISLAISQIV